MILPQVNMRLPDWVERFLEDYSAVFASVEERMRWFLSDDSATSKYLGASSVGEILGQLYADTHVFFNKRDEEAAQAAS